MVSGVEIYNDSGVIQITSKFRNLQYLGKVELTIPANNILSLSSKVEIPVEIGTEWVAFKCSNDKYIVDAIVYASPYDGSKLVVVKGRIGANVTCYKFGFPSTPGKYFEVYNELAELIFSDTAKYMKILESRNGSYTQAEFDASVLFVGSEIEAQVPTVTGTINIPSGKDVAIMGQLASYCWREYVNGKYAGQWLWDVSQVFTFNASTITYGLKTHDYNDYKGYGIGLVMKPYYNFLVIDVTGL